MIDQGDNPMVLQVFQPMIKIMDKSDQRFVVRSNTRHHSGVLLIILHDKNSGYRMLSME